VTDGRPTRAGRGRRPGSADTRLLILVAARGAFADRGFDGATVRDVAARAGVDPALVLHYFGSKQALFVAAMQFPVDLQAMVRRLLGGPVDEIGERYVRFVLDIWDDPATRSVMLGIVRSATTDPVAAAMLRRIVSEGPVLTLAAALDRPDATLRATLAGSQVVGLIMVRYVIGVEPLASAAEDVLVRTLGATIQHYLTGDLGPGASGTSSATP
jgi:AcrR family transcriptional regulator